MPDKYTHTILLVDDDKNVLKALERLLQNIEANVIAVDNGEKALEILKDKTVSIIIADQRMPGMKGVELLCQMQDIYPGGVRILLTGYNDIDDAVKGVQSVAITYYYNKPWDDDLFLQRIEESLRNVKVQSMIKHAEL